MKAVRKKDERGKKFLNMLTFESEKNLFLN